jgi:hypothetical protein
MSLPNIDQLAHDLIAENKALGAVVKKHRLDSGLNKAYDILCFIIAYPHIIGTIKNNNPAYGGVSPNIQLERICLNVDKEDISVKIYEILDNIDDVFEKVLLMITIVQVAVFKPETKDKLVSIMEKYVEFKLILEIYGCLN